MAALEELDAGALVEGLVIVPMAATQSLCKVITGDVQGDVRQGLVRCASSPPVDAGGMAGPMV